MNLKDPGTSMLTSEEESLLARLLEKGIREIKPKIGPEGVTYDVLALLEEYSGQKLQQLLDALVDKGFITPKEHDRALFCLKCGAVHVYSKYTCPRCQSIRVNLIELIEHPFCGYMGDKEKFISGSSLLCPNCKMDLGSVGGEPPRDGSRRDYKVIGSSFECEKCGYRFDRPNVLHVCQRCGANFNYKTMRYKKLYTYEITEQTMEILGRIPQMSTILKPIEAALSVGGYNVEFNGRVTGLSGGEHTFDIVAQKDSSRVVVDVSMRGNQNDIISLLGKKMDVNPTTSILIDMSGSEEISALGKVYNIVILNGKEKKLEKKIVDHLESMKIAGDR